MHRASASQPAIATGDSLSHRSADRLSIAALVLFSIVAGAGLWSHAGLAPDSVTYLDEASNLVAGKGLVYRWAYWDPIYETAQLPTATSMWPPGLSLVIAVLHAGGMSPYAAARLVGVLAFMVLALSLYGLARFIVRPSHAFIAVLAAIVPVLPWVPIIASELPYVAAATLASFCAAQAIFVAEDAEILWWLGASAAAGASFAFRYVGLANAFQIGLVALFFSSRKGLGQTIRRAVAAGSISGIIIAAIFFRNWMVSGKLGQPWPGAHIFWTTLLPSIKAAVSIELGGRELWGPLVLLAAPAEFLALVVLFVVAGRKVFSTWMNRRDAQDSRALGTTAIVVLMLVCTYGVTILATAANGMDLEDRYLLAPVPWAVLLLAAWCLRGAAPLRQRVFAPAWVAVVVWLAFQSLMTLKVLSLPQASYVQAAETSDVVAWVRQHVPPGETLLSNRGAELAYWLPNPVMRLPRLPHASHGSTSWDDVDRLAHKAGAHYLVHYKNYPEYAKYQQQEFDFLRTLDNSSAYQEREPQTFADAIVYKVDLKDVDR